MTKYVDAEKELAEMKFAWHTQDMDTTNAIGMYEYFLKTAPSADVAPVVHAHWIETEDLSGNHYAECSNCCLLWWIDGESSQEAEMNYCPRCGAKMDEVD